MLKGTMLTAAVATALVLSLLMIAAPAQATGEWEGLGDMPFQAEGFSIAQLPDGRVLFNGGLSQDQSEMYPDTWLYDPSTDEWEMREPAPVATYGSSAVHMPDGRVYLFSGTLQNNTWMLGVMVYDLAGDSWTMQNELEDIGWMRQAAALDGERIMLAGGLEGQGPTVIAECQIYNVRTMTFSPAASLPAAVFGGTMVKAGGSLYYIGGSDLVNPHILDIYRYDLSAGVWTTHGKLTEMRYMNQGVLGADGLVYLYGVGLPPQQCPYLRALDLRDCSFRDCPTYPVEGSAGGIAATDDGRVIVFGGSHGGEVSQKVHSLSLYERAAWLEPASASRGGATRVHVHLEAVVAGGETMTATAYLVRDGVTYGRCELFSLGDAASASMALPEDLVPGEYQVHIRDVDLGTGIAGTVQFDPLTLTVTDAPTPTDRIGELEDKLDGKMDAWLGYAILGIAIATLLVALLMMVRRR